MTLTYKMSEYAPMDAGRRFADDLAGQLDAGPLKAGHVRQRLIHNRGMFRKFWTKKRKNINQIYSFLS